MNPSYLLLIFAFILCFFVSKWLTSQIIRYAGLFQLIDKPNSRSSHSQPTPRGGGIAIAATLYLALGIAHFFGFLNRDWILPIVTGGALVTLIGLLDDRYNLRATLRLMIHFISALIAYLLLTKGFTTPIALSLIPITNPFFVAIFCLLFISWNINLYNFMDGIDGLAGTQALIVSLLSSLLCYWQGSPKLFFIYGVLSFSSAGFLYYNWSPAKIFMGDSGAYFIGYTFSVLALMAKVFLGLSITAHIILLGVFIVDATYTLLVRISRRQKAHVAHKTFAFHKVVDRGLHHKRVNIFYNMITLFWLAPLAVCSVIYYNLSFLLLIIAYTPLVIFMIYIRAGLETTRVSPNRSKENVGLEPLVNSPE